MKQTAQDRQIEEMKSLAAFNKIVKNYLTMIQIRDSKHNRKSKV
jgi:hypothetical protein